MQKTYDIFKYGKKVEWSIPVMFCAEPLWTSIYKVLKEYNIVAPKVNAYGCPACAWTGGRRPEKQLSSIKNLGKLFDYMNECNAVPTFAFSYSDLKKEDLNDWFCNALLDIALEHNTKFIVYSDLLKDYIRKKDPNAFIIASVVKAHERFNGVNRIEEPTPENETNYYNELLKEYDMVVVRPEYSKKVLIEHPEYIDDISRIKVIINSLCVPGCPIINEHYKVCEKYRFGNDPSVSFECIRNRSPKFADKKNYGLLHSNSQVKKLVKAGVKNLKLQGRGDGIPLEILLFLFYTQMFNSDGEAFSIMLEIATKLYHEVMYISQLQAS